MSGPYFDSTNLEPAELAEATAVAESQDALILRIFQRHPGELMTPSRVLTLCQLQGRRFLSTSVRRAMSNLTRRGLLEHVHTEKRPGPNYRPETCWRLA